MNPLRAELLQRGVEFFPRATKVRVVLVAECEYGEGNFLQPRRVRRRERGEQMRGVVRRVAFAPGARNQQQPFAARELLRCAGVRLQQLRGETQRGGFLAELFRQPFRAAGLAAVENEQRFGGDRFGCGDGRLRRRVGERSQPGEVAVEPRALLRVERCRRRHERDAGLQSHSVRAHLAASVPAGRHDVQGLV